MKKQSMRSRYHESSAAKKEAHGYKKSKHPEKSFKKFEKKEHASKPMDSMEKAEHKFKKARLKARSEMPKMEKVMSEYKHGSLHSGSKKGPKVKSRKQAIAIGLSEARKAKNK